MKPGAPPQQSVRLLDQVGELAGYVHYSLKTDKAYLYGVRFLSVGVLLNPAVCAIRETWTPML